MHNIQDFDIKWTGAYEKQFNVQLFNTAVRLATETTEAHKENPALLQRLSHLPWYKRVSSMDYFESRDIRYFGELLERYVSFSGGKDSTVLLHLVRELYPDVPAVFSDTGLEFPEIREFVKTIPNVIWLKPDMTFRKVLEKYGYPVIGKEQAKWIDEARRGDAEGQCRRLYGVRGTDKRSTFRISDQWHYLMNAPFKISDECCNEMKKKPMKRYAHETGRVPIIGTMAEESKLRTQHWLQEGCNAYDAKRPTSKPMSFWTEADVWQYIRENDIPYARVYDMGYSRTGCIFCMFGAHYDGEPTRFQRLQRTHPKLWRYCMRDWEAGGLGMRRVLEYMGIPFENYIGDLNEHRENPGCPAESRNLQPPCRSETGRQGIREAEKVDQ